MISVPRVSILIPCYNAERYVGPAIQSALAQTWPNREIIVVDDGSTDRSRKMVETFEDRGVRVFHQPNAGQSAAANRAFLESNGEYIKFFDADDLLHPELIERQMQRLNHCRDAVASAEWGRFYRDDIKTFMLNPEPVWRDLPATEWLVQAWMEARSMMQCAIFLMHRELLERSGLWDERLTLVNDYEFFTRVLCNAKEVRFTSGAPVYYRSGLNNSLSQQRSPQAVLSAYTSFAAGTEYLLREHDDAKARAACANILQDFVYTYYPEGGELCDKAAFKVRQLGGSNFKASGGTLFNAIQPLLGWKAATRLQKLAFRFGYKRVAIGRWLDARTALGSSR